MDLKSAAIVLLVAVILLAGAGGLWFFWQVTFRG